MHPNPIFRQAGCNRNRAFARDRGFGTLALNAENGPLMSHVPFLLADDGQSADLHLVRSNPIVGLLSGPKPAVLAVSGPDGYVSPDWYGIAEQVPTWNYVAVHLRGMLELLPQDQLRGLLDRQSAFFEARLAPKPPWMPAKMTPDVIDRMMRMIVPCRLSVGRIDGTWKLSQNKAPDVRRAAADGAARAGERPDLIDLMRWPPAD